MHLVPPEAPALDSLGLPAGARDLVAPGGRPRCWWPRGPGGGKTTTLAALIDDLDDQPPGRVVTIEDPVEIVLKDRRSVVVQREVGLDVPIDRGRPARVARQDVDVLCWSASSPTANRPSWRLTAAETGRLVLAGVIGRGSPTRAPSRAWSRLWDARARRAGARARASAAVLRGVLRPAPRLRRRRAARDAPRRPELPRASAAAAPPPAPAAGAPGRADAGV